MTPTKIIDFIIKHDGKITDVRPIYQSYAYFQKLIEAKQVIRIRRKKRMVAFFSYYRVKDYEDCLKTDESWQLPDNYTQGDKIFIDVMAVKPEFRGERMTLEFRKRLIKKEPNAKEVAGIDVNNRLRIHPLKKEIAK